MTAVIFEFPVRARQAERPAQDLSLNAQVIIFSGVRQERLDVEAQPDETRSPSSPRHKKTS
jgi:hypothetical protein